MITLFLKSRPIRFINGRYSMYEKYSMEIIFFTNKDVFADWDGSIIDGDHTDPWSLKPDRSDS